MPEFCPSCGGTIDPNSPFCPTCGRQAPEPAVSTAAQYQAAPPPPPQYQPPRPVYQAPQPVYQAVPQNTEMAPVLGLGSYIGMILLSAIPTVGFILLLVWAFSSGENPNKRNFARGVLLCEVIVFALIIAFYVVVLVLGGLSYIDSSTFSSYRNGAL